MKYSDGHEAELGDIVAIGHDVVGTVVLLVKEGLAADGFVSDEWSYLKDGLLVDSSDMGLIHYPDGFTDRLSLGVRASNSSN